VRFIEAVPILVRRNPGRHPKSGRKDNCFECPTHQAFVDFLGPRCKRHVQLRIWARIVLTVGCAPDVPRLSTLAFGLGRGGIGGIAWQALMQAQTRG
jgi:hypothetical protein